ncbi:putative ribosome quality control (RQC) complex YloA/Tae2 family protein [Halanaerobium saccharolyticum]|uniref:Rqc2 homolog RqcH n=1 Tax=Halanaerobium saccharolyticum TaxID=43595 RepID=A0A4R6LP56_9FIRM|nr:NFACT RNA binding domain-containing protein [Halanaerobium saccharolyticum]TDO87800.1 putative ribosome quality control (RQC) complex YloA/Tae2 family protein [Halanaerobium saccharolyticum]
MAFDGIMLSALKDNLKEKITGARIEKAYQIDKKYLIIRLRNNNQNLELLISTDPQGARMNLTELDFDFPSYPPDFCMMLRKYLKNSYIQQIVQPKFERMIRIDIEKRGKKFSLIAELMGKYSNVILLDDNEMVLDAMKRITEKQNSERQLYPGIKYQNPPGQDKLNPLELNTKDEFRQIIEEDFSQAAFRAVMYNFRGIGPYSAREIVFRAGIDPSENYNDLSDSEKNRIAKSLLNLFAQFKKGIYNPVLAIEKGEVDYISAFILKHRDPEKIKKFEDLDLMMDYYFREFLKDRELKRGIRELNKVVNTYLNKNLKKQKKLKKQLQESKNAEKYKKMGELITANIYQIDRGDKKVVVNDYYSKDQNEIEIKLDPSKSASENAQKYFKKYNKLKKSVKHLKREIAKLRHEEKYLKQVSMNIEQAETLDDLEEIKEELKEENYIKKQKQNKRNKSNKKLPPRKFISSDGYQILVGRNNKQNDRLTKKIANDGDIWLHTKVIAGSHVIIKRDTEKEVPDQTLTEAAAVAAYYSKARESTNVPIDYTPVENVNKPKGAKPGLVYYEKYQTIYIDPADKTLLKKLAAD